MLQSHQYQKRGFTLIELALGVAMVAVGSALVLPAMRGSRDEARRTACRNNLKQIGLALHNYNSAFKMFPCGWTTNKLSWHARILPFVEQTNIYNKLNFLVPFAPWDANLKTQIPVYRCAADRGAALAGGLGRSNYAGVLVGTPSNTTGESTHGGGSFGLDSFRSIRDYTDGMSNTLMVGERMSTARLPSSMVVKGTEGTWVGLNPGELSIVSSPSLGAINSIKYGVFSSPHHLGPNFLLGDGSVLTISPSIDAKTFAAYCTIDGGETPPKNY